MDLTDLIVPALALVAGLAGGWFARPKTRAEAKLAEAKTDDLIVNRLYAHIDRLDKQLVKTTEASENLCKHLSNAKDEVVRLRETMDKAAEQLEAGKLAEAEATLKKADDGPKGKAS